MFKPFRTVAVLGAGVMGTQIAAHLANVGLTVHLLDLAAPGDRKNEIVETAFKKASKQSPPVLFTEQAARRIILGNFDENFDRVAKVDWIIEAVVEKLEVKQQLMARLDGSIRNDAIVSTNTSGLPIREIIQGCSEDLRQRFLGTHFFNPPRYLKLLELIPTVETAPEVLERLQWFGRIHLGKGIVVAKDTPNFIANRIAMFATMQGLYAIADRDYTIAEIDTLTGTLIGRPKSATFRTADLVGLDTLMYVANHLYTAVEDDERRDRFRVPDLLQKLVSSGRLGAKSGQGFYKKEQQQILALQPETLTYELPQPLDLGNLEAISSIENLGDRLRALYRDSGRGGAFFRRSTLELLSYCACRVPEITDNPAEIDRAMRWGFGWEIGSFEMWDRLGFHLVLTDMKADRLPVPAWIEIIAQTTEPGFYQFSPPTTQIYNPAQKQYLPLQQPEDEISIAALKADPGRILWQNSDATLLDLDDGVLLYEFHSKGNTLGYKVMEGLSAALQVLETKDYRGLVIGNDSANFSGGANLAEMGALAAAGDFEVIGKLLGEFQTTFQSIYYASKPIVAAVQGRALGGGCELVMACPQVVAAAETYIGLVELSVGLIPGAGGVMRMVARAAERAATDTAAHIQPFLKTAFETIAMAKVSSSASEAQALGFLPPKARIVMNGDRRLYVAKQEVINLARSGYLPPPERHAIVVLGRPALAQMELTAYTVHQGGAISEYDRYLANRLAYVMSGGNLSAPTPVRENYLLGLEREVFVPLLGQPKTQERIAYLLKHKKPLRN
ncbi:3-hydroxyacyl-CoA dehydrogenase/enoyl-CoA hydratase family protein [Pseudanabaena sp. PCC 6802]|uniref:3-hydroxyacyl-CoA dehydrogenase/enoyl-CoA hydratase family protein n=1 Tax=Pseudanabaena sp. PCC 6802 TaxID=118173 RepID=UPI0003485ADA|nr:3-hydroxyacyl-CoA dehydrogenase/enoyl-CoA hydratase family protein [Pseudanabaena sp. PCC 6802]